jgi:hypothetical protein
MAALLYQKAATATTLLKPGGMFVWPLLLSPQETTVPGAAADVEEGQAASNDTIIITITARGVPFI